MTTTLEIPDFRFAAFYYPELYDALIEHKRRNVPEHTDESPYDAYMQFLSMQALVGHLNNCLIDLVANESTLPTSRLQETVRNMLQLIDYQLRTAVPSQVDVVMELSKVFVAAFELVPQYARASTSATPQVYFEDLTGLTIARTDQFGAVYGLEASTFADYTDKANSQVTPGDDWTPWASPAVGDAIYFGHGSVMWDLLTMKFTTPGSGMTGVWEFYDGEFRKVAPDAVELDASTLVHDLSGYLGASPRPGTSIRVQYNETTAYEDVVSLWDGSKNYVVTSYLGQTSPKYNTGGGSPTTDAETYYTVGSDWEVFDDMTDGSLDFTQDGDLQFTIPQSVAEYWKQAEVNSFTGYWIRYRLVEVSTPVAPVFQYVRMDLGVQYILRSMVQGQLQVDAPVGSSTGLADQEFEVNKEYYIDGSMEVLVDGEAWTLVENFLSSRSTDKHFRVVISDNDQATIIFGDGTKGKIPPLGVGNVEATYRWGANEDGNVGARSVSIDQTGLSYIATIYNPRPASGWAIAEGSTEESLEQAKIAGPASLRIKEVALGPDDIEEMAILYTAADGTSPFSRAKAFEEGFGPKTIELVVVARGGNQASAEQLSALQTYFNGDKFSNPPLPQRIVANQEVVVVNFTPEVFDVTATVYANDVTAAQIQNQLIQIFQPESLKADGVTYQWEFGEDVPLSRIQHEIFETSQNITNVVLTLPGSDVPLSSRQLPATGAISITVVSS